MFEAESKEYAKKTSSLAIKKFNPLEPKLLAIGFQDGAECGYNKAKKEAEDIINELLMNGYCESTREKAFNFLYPDKEG